MARLHHPNIVEVFDVAEASTDDAFLVTELVRGQTLRAFAERERCWPPELGAILVQQVALALAHAHQAGVVHRDLKPENIMLREDGVLKLMDFGIARVLDPAERMTQTGALVGSPAYMAPEVIDGQAAGPEADVFALGTLLYWLWTAALPFAAPSTSAMLKRILDGLYEDPRAATPALSDGLAAILRPLPAAPAGGPLPDGGRSGNCAVRRAGGGGTSGPGRRVGGLPPGPGTSAGPPGGTAGGHRRAAGGGGAGDRAHRPGTGRGGPASGAAPATTRWGIRCCSARSGVTSSTGAGVACRGPASAWRPCWCWPWADASCRAARPAARPPTGRGSGLARSPHHFDRRRLPGCPRAQPPATPSGLTTPVAPVEKRPARVESVPVELLVRPYGRVQWTVARSAATRWPRTRCCLRRGDTPSG